MSRSSVPAISVAVPPSRRGLDDPCTKMLHTARPPSSHSDRTQTSGVPNELADACLVRPCRQYPSLSHRRGGGSTTHAQKCSTTQDRLPATRIDTNVRRPMSTKCQVRPCNIRRCPTVAEGARRLMHKNAPHRKTAFQPLGSSGVPNELADACLVRPCRQYPSLSHRRGGGSTTHAQKCSTPQDRLQATRIAHKRQASRMSSQMHVSFVRAGNIRRCPTVAEGARRPMHKNAPQRKTASKPLGSHTNVRCPE